jgi:site-specific recombinase XerD
LSELAAHSASIVQASPEVEQARSFIRSSRAAATLRAYAGDWRRFEAWCALHSVTPLPASAGAVALFLSVEAQGGAKVSTITRRSAAIRYMHELHRHASPTTDPEVLALVSSIRRTIGPGPFRRRPQPSVG